MTCKKAHASMSVHGGEGASVRCHTYAASTPILSVSWPQMWLDIALADRQAQVSEQAVQFARDLSAAAQQFAAEAERLYTLRARAPQDAAA